MNLDCLVRNAQDLLGPRVTHFAQSFLGPRGTRFVRELIGRSVPHRVQISRNLELIGAGVDAWMICPDHLHPRGVVYSLGVGNIILSDLDLINKYDVDVFAFDPTPGAVAWIKKQSLPTQFHFIAYGIMDYDGTAHFQHFGDVQFGPLAYGSRRQNTIEVSVCRLGTAMKQLKHSKIDLLKMNIEGGEYAVLADLVRSRLEVDQIVVEFHHRLPGYALEDTRRVVQALNDYGYKLFHIAENGKEYSFLGPSM